MWKLPQGRPAPAAPQGAAQDDLGLTPLGAPVAPPASGPGVPQALPADPSARPAAPRKKSPERGRADPQLVDALLRGDRLREEPGPRIGTARLQTRKPRPGMLLLATYLLGPLSPVVLRQGRRSAAWAFAGMLGVAGWGVMVWQWQGVRAGLETGAIPVLPWLLGVGLATAVFVAAWGRAVLLCGSDDRFVPERLPAALRHPVAVVPLGMLFPGSGLLISGHPLRAALALWNLAPVVLSFLALSHGGWLWACNRSSGAQGLPALALEVVLLASTVSGFLGGLAWIAAALDGGRLTRMRAGYRASSRSDWLGFAFGVAVLAFFVTLGPVKLARNLDQLAEGMRHEGYRLIPLCMERGAMLLDPSRPVYALRAAEFYDLLGKSDQAAAIRADLEVRWRDYAERILQQDVGTEGLKHPTPIVPRGSRVDPARGSVAPPRTQR